MKNLLIFLITVAVITIILWLFLFGKLFPYTPIILGFEKNELGNVIIYSQKGSEFQGVNGADTIITVVENFHNLQFKTKPELFIFRDSSSYIKHSPSKARFCTFPNSRIFITPWAMSEVLKGKISLEIYLKHELSHSLIFQHTGFLGALRYPDWLLEGLAVYSSNQMGTSSYPDKTRTYSLIAAGNYMPPGAYKTKIENDIILDVPDRINFIYSEFACIVDYLVTRFGRDKFIIYVKRIISEYNHEKVFEEIYGFKFENFLDDFRKDIRQKI
ncbi:MAG: hypothetical protein JW965_05865 [Bacteroidales bacterium]|nr:hypothetical protein [Bacteroidales bacterium]